MLTVHEPIVDALRRLLSSRDAPRHRVELAVRATQALVGRAMTKRRDGTVYVITGDIPAMWLRDSTAQVRPLLTLAADVPDVVDLMTGVLRLQVEQVLVDPWANAFDIAPDGSVRVFERKYELDSLCAPLQLGWLLWQATASTSHVDARFLEATYTIVSLWRREQAHEPGSYVFRRRLGRGRASLSHGGKGAPVSPTGMIWSGFRPSDDRCVYGYNVAANALAAVTLERVADLLAAAGAGSDGARALAAKIRAGIARHGVVEDAEGGLLYAYEVDGLGHALLMDDANVPSLLALPYVGFCAADDPLYRATRDWVLGPRNPYWARGRVVHGVGSEHTRHGWVWPLAIAMEGLTAETAAEREEALRRIEATVTADGLLHESVDPNDPRRFTRSWFSWADMLYVELVLASVGVSNAQAVLRPNR